MAETKINEQINSNPNEFYFVSKTECDIEETVMEVVEDGACTDSDDYETPHIREEMSYYQDDLSADDSIEEFDPDVHSILRKNIKSEWSLSEPDLDRDSFFDDPEDDEEETIATFVTSTGQQLALYAVEDSDEVFAVAEYDESGQPPTNFQFLMKSDVEKLIGEGAVRTVKKPTLMKKQTYRGNEKEKELLSPNKVKVENIASAEFAPLDAEVKFQDHNLHKIDMKDVHIDDDLTYQEVIDATYVMEDHSISSNQKNHIVEAIQPEIVHESTVQNIFHDDDDQSDEELTFDEIEKSLATFGKNPTKSRSILKKSFDSTINKSTDSIHKNVNGVITVNETFELKAPLIKKIIDKPTRQIVNHSGLKTRHIPRALLGRKGKAVDTATVFIHGSTALICCPIQEVEPELKIAKESDSSGLSKIKRPRKQQLTIVDRADSEIIIQPASLVEEQEEEPAPKKKGRRKKKRSDFSNYSKQISKSKRRRIEVIDIDVDEEQERHVEEITIDDNKENEVIMVDSDDTSQEDKSNSVILKCEYCSRGFRQKRALDTHTRVCPKSPSTRRRVERELKTKSSDLNSGNKKQYVCKICAEKFDVVVALARHVRSHNKKKTPVENMNTEQVMDSESLKVDEKENKINNDKSKLKNNQTKNKNKIAQLWKVKKMSCTDCGRWFASSALLSAHRLQHATKKSEKQKKRCRLCKKLFRSRIVFMHHMKMHSKGNKLQKTLRHTRQSTTKMTNLRKRGRSRKL